MIIALLLLPYQVELWMARAWGRFRLWLTSEWRSPLLWLLLTAFLVPLPGFLAETHRNPSPPRVSNPLPHSGTMPWRSWHLGHWNWHFTQTMGLFLFVWLLTWAWQARKRVVVEEFTDYTGDPSNAAAKGLSTLLLIELGRLRDLYREVDDEGAVHAKVMSNAPIEATIKVEDVSEFLKGAVSPDTKFSMGPIALPVGTLMALIGRFVQGPRIIGSLHKDGDTLILSAQSARLGRPYSWRVDNQPGAELPPTPRSNCLEPMITELAYRMFTDLALNESVLWRATKTFSEGLSLLRTCLRSDKDRDINLKKAEQKFIQTLCEDNKFFTAYYNLGVVYTELRRPDAAEAAFLKALEKNPDLLDAYYALGLNRLNMEQYDRAISLCQRILANKPTGAMRAKTYDLMGYSYRRTGDLRNAIRCRKKAASCAWHTLCLFERNQKGQDKFGSAGSALILLTGACMRGLAVAWAYKTEYYIPQIVDLENSVKSRREQIRIQQEKLAEDAREVALMKTNYESQNREPKTQQETIGLQQNVSDEEQTQAVTEKTKLQEQQLRLQKTEIEEKDLFVRSQEKLFEKQKKIARAQEQRDNLKIIGLFLKRHIAFRSAEAWLRRAMMIVGEGADLCYELAKIYQEWGKSRQAIQYYWLAIQIAPRNANYWADLATAYAKVDEWQETYKACESVLNLSDPGNATYDDGLNKIAETIAKTFDYLVSTGQVFDGWVTREPEQFREYRNLIQAIAQGKKGDDLVHLEKQLTELETSNLRWEAGILSYRLGQLYLSSGKPDEAEKKYRKAIENLAAYPGNIRQLGLRPLLAQSLSAQKKYQEALQEAEEAFWLDPLESYELDTLGQVFFDLGEYDRARESWENALLWNPNAPLLFWNVAFCYLQTLSNIRSVEKREEALRLAAGCLTKASLLYRNDKGDFQAKLKTHSLLGYIQLEANDYVAAVSSFTIAKTQNYEPLMTSLYLAVAYQKNKLYNECEKQCRELIALAQKERDNGKSLQDSAGNDYIIPMSFGQLIALVHLFLARSYIERNTNQEQALKLIRNAEEVSREIQDEDAQAECRTHIAFLEGWILSQQGKADDAILCLERATSLRDDAENSLHLGMAYEQKLQDCTDAVECRVLRSRIQACCDHVQEVDVKQEFVKPVAELLQRLQTQPSPESVSDSRPVLVKLTG